jgi:hypothetical protein
VDEGLVLDVGSAEEVEDSTAEEPTGVTLLASVVAEEDADVGVGVVVSEAEVSEAEGVAEDATEEASGAEDEAALECSEGAGVAVVRRVVGTEGDGFDVDTGGGAEAALDGGGVADDSTGYEDG